MKYSWRVIKYARQINQESDRISYCNTDLEALSQTIVHSQFDTQNVRKEKWMHIYSGSIKTLELVLSEQDIEVRLIVTKDHSKSIVVLEHVDVRAAGPIKICSKQRVLGLKYGSNFINRFQVVFVSKEEADIFLDKYNAGIVSIADSVPHVTIRKLFDSFLEMVQDVKVKSVNTRHPTTKSRTELIKEFLRLVE